MVETIDMQMIPVPKTSPLTRAHLTNTLADMERIAETVRLTTGASITAEDLVKIGEAMYAAPLDYGDQAIELLSPDVKAEPGGPGKGKQPPPPGYTNAPRLSAYRFIPRDGSPNRLLERYDPEEALEVITKQHRMMADWIRSNRGRPGWDLDAPTREMWPYIHASKRLKSCREQLQQLVDELEREEEAKYDWMDAQDEADRLAWSEENA